MKCDSTVECVSEYPWIRFSLSRKKIEQSARDLSMVSGAKQLTEGADFYTKDELAQFRKKSRADKPQKKKRRAATTLADEVRLRLNDKYFFIFIFIIFFFFVVLQITSNSFRVPHV